MIPIKSTSPPKKINGINADAGAHLKSSEKSLVWETTWEGFEENTFLKEKMGGNQTLPEKDNILRKWEYKP